MFHSLRSDPFISLTLTVPLQISSFPVCPPRKVQSPIRTEQNKAAKQNALVPAVNFTANPKTLTEHSSS